MYMKDEVEVALYWLFFRLCKKDEITIIKVPEIALSLLGQKLRLPLFTEFQFRTGNQSHKKLQTHQSVQHI